MDVAIFIIFFSLSIVVHELGHLLVANFLGQNIRNIHLGFGPIMGQISLRSLTFVIHCIPLGGYVQVNAFESKWRDVLTLSAGIVINGLAAFVLMVVGSSMMNHQTQIEGLYQGKKTQNIMVEGNKVLSWHQLNQYFLYQSILGDPAVIEINGTQLKIMNDIEEVVKHQVLNKIQMMPTLPVQSMTIQQVIHPCLMNKMLPGDKIISLNQMPVNNVMSLIYLLNTKNHDEMVIGLKNKSEEKTFYFQPGIKDGQNVLGVTFQLVPQTTGQLSIPDALDYVIDDINRAFKLQFLVLWGLLIGQLSLSDLSGPIGLYQAFQGIVSWYVMGDYLLLLGKINLILGLFNLLPIPPLDGGALFMRFFVWGKNAVAIRNLITNIGLIIIIELGIYTTLNDMNLLGSEQDVSPHFVNRCD